VPDLPAGLGWDLTTHPLPPPNKNKKRVKPLPGLALSVNTMMVTGPGLGAGSGRTSPALPSPLGRATFLTVENEYEWREEPQATVAELPLLKYAFSPSIAPS